MTRNYSQSPVVEINLLPPLHTSFPSNFCCMRSQPRPSPVLSITADYFTHLPQPHERYERSMSSDIGYWDRSHRRSPGSTIWSPHPPQAPAPPPPSRSFTTPLYNLPYGAPPRRISYDSGPSSSGGPPPVPHPPPASFVAFQQNAQNHRRWRSQDAYEERQEPRKFKRSRAWPPRGFDKSSLLSPPEAEDLIAHGASSFRGLIDESPHAPGTYRFFAVMDTESDFRSDRAHFQDESFAAITLPITGQADAKFPWCSLEQPCMGYAFGRSPGTTTLTYYVGQFGTTKSPLKYASKARPRKMKLIDILDRLRDLEVGFGDEHPEETYHYLYDTLIEDPERFRNPHYDRALQIADLITVLSNLEWIDFSQPRNQVVAKFFDSADEKVKQRFFHQLLLAVELHLRIQSAEHTEKAKRDLLAQLPPKVSWDLALAQRWLENMTVTRSEVSASQSTFTFELLSKKRQKNALKAFAKLLKWPNILEIGYVLRESDPAEKPLEDRSADTMSWFTGVILPGPTMPFLLMNSLVDCDRDAGLDLGFLSHVYPATGFQYRANSYWNWKCIMGKVLGAGRGVRCVAGWVGPCLYSPDLDRTQCVLVRQVEPPERPRIGARDLESIDARSDPLGSTPRDGLYPVQEFEEWIPDLDSDDLGGAADVIRVQKLAFREVLDERSPLFNVKTGRGARLYDTAVVFAVAGESKPLRLRYDVDFVSAFPCQSGPHPLFWDYRFCVVKVEDGLKNRDVGEWFDRHRDPSASFLADPYYRNGIRSMPASPHHRTTGRRSMSVGGSSSLILGRERDRERRAESPTGSAPKRFEEVLVIEAYGVSDNEVFARAWCAQYGFDALVANIKDTCISCAIREAYAACLSVAILTEGGRASETESLVDGENGYGEDGDHEDGTTVADDAVSLGYLYGKA